MVLPIQFYITVTKLALPIQTEEIPLFILFEDFHNQRGFRLWREYPKESGGIRENMQFCRVSERILFQWYVQLRQVPVPNPVSCCGNGCVLMSVSRVQSHILHALFMERHGCFHPKCCRLSVFLQVCFSNRGNL